jgi:hypothetical protein
MKRRPSEPPGTNNHRAFEDQGPHSSQPREEPTLHHIHMLLRLHAYVPQNYRVFGIYPVSDILKSRTHRMMDKVQKPSNCVIHPRQNLPDSTACTSLSPVVLVPL